MGSAISNAVGGVGATLGNVVTSLAKSVFNRSCQDVCSGIWDIGCFLEHVCVHDLIKLLMIFGLWYLTFLFIYLLFKLRICQCMTKVMCKICWHTCAAYWSAIGNITSFCWQRIKNTRRVYRGRRVIRDVEAGFSSDYHHSTTTNHLHDSPCANYSSLPRKRKLRERRVMKKKMRRKKVWRRRRRTRRRRNGLRKTARSRSLSFRVGSSRTFARVSDRVMSRTSQGSSRKKKKKIRTSKRRRLG